MATLLITKSITVNGVATDADSTPTLTDSGATYGIKRLDTDAIVVAAATALTKVATGQYQYSYASAIEGVEYQWSIAFVINGETIYDVDSRAVTVGTTSTLSVTGSYGTSADMEAVYGIENIAMWSDMSGSSVADASRVQWASDAADAIINGHFNQRAYGIPLSFTATWGTALAKRWYGVLGGYELYRTRGYKAGDKIAELYRSWVKGVYSEMSLYAGGTLILPAQRRWPTPTAPVGF